MPTQIEVVDGLIRVEDVRAEVARRALEGGRVRGARRELVDGLRARSRERSVVLRAHLEALGGGLDGPEPLELADEPVLAELARAPDGAAVLAVLARLERVAIDTGARALGRLEVPEIVRTVGSVIAGHGQELAALKLALGVQPV